MARLYALAMFLAGAAVLARSEMEQIAPGITYLAVLLPTVVLAGVFCGTRPAMLTAFLGFVAIVALFQRHAITARPPLNTTQVDALVFLPACASVLWATSILRRYARSAVAAEARPAGRRSSA